MRNTLPHHLDPVRVIIDLVLTFGGSLVASEIVGPYAVIVIMASIGAAWSVGAKKEFEHDKEGKLVKVSRFKANRDFLLLVITATFATYYITQLIVNLFGEAMPELADGSPINWVMGLVALTIGVVGTHWKLLGKYLFARIRKLLGGDNE